MQNKTHKNIVKTNLLIVGIVVFILNYLAKRNSQMYWLLQNRKEQQQEQIKTERTIAVPKYLRFNKKWGVKLTSFWQEKLGYTNQFYDYY